MNWSQLPPEDGSQQGMPHEELKGPWNCRALGNWQKEINREIKRN
jgi:hypothetical protein